MREDKERLPIKQTYIVKKRKKTRKTEEKEKETEGQKKDK